MLADELGKVLERELVHALVSEVNQLLKLKVVQLLTWQHWVSQQLPQDLGGLKNAFAQLKESFFDFIKVGVPVFGVLTQKSDKYVAHVVGDDLVLDEEGLVVDVV